MSIYGDGIINAYSFNMLTFDDEMPGDPASVRFRSIAEIMLRGIHRCLAENFELHGESGQTSNAEEPVLRNLESSLPEPLDFVSDNPLSVSDVSETPGLEAWETFKKEVSREQRSEKQRHRGSAGQRGHSGQEATTGGEGDRVANASEA